MIELTCGACGTVQRVSEMSLPPNARTAPCRACKAPIALAPGGDALDLADLPAPRSAPRPPTAPVAAARASDGVDLPAPVRAPSRGAAPPAPPARGGDSELPAPVSRPRTPPPVAAPLDLLDLPAPAPLGGRGGDAELPAPVRRPPPAAPAPLAPPPIEAPGLNLDDLLAPVSAAPAADLPAPKRAGTDLGDLPRPKRGSVLGDLPAPKGPSGTVAGLGDLLAPKAGPGGLSDLPAPKGPAGLGDLPAPKGPVGSLDDLLAPVGVGLSDLPAPKGPAGLSDLPAPKGPAGLSDLPAPKAGGGLFDDLPMPASPSLPAPKAAAPMPARLPTLDLPDLFGDNAPAAARGPAPRPAPAAAPAAAPKPAMGAPLDLDDLDLGLGGAAAAPPPAAKKPPVSFAATAPAMGAAPPPAAPMLDLGDDLGLELPSKKPAAAPASPDFGDLDLPSAGSTAAGPVGAAAHSMPGKPTEKAAAAQRMQAGLSDANLDIEDTKGDAGAPVMSDKAKAAKAAADAKAAAKAKDAEAADPAKAKRKRAIMAGAGLVAVGLGVGGFMFYRRWSAKKKLTEQLTAHVGDARTALSAADAAHWQRAITKASEALGLAPDDAVANAVLAEAHFAAALDLGLGRDGHVQQGKAALAKANAARGSSAELAKASALELILDDQPAAAIPKLAGLAANDADAALFLGWAHEAAGQHAEAVTAFDNALKLAPKREVSARLGRGRAKLALGDLEAARAEFAAVLGVEKTNVAAQVGLAAAAAPADLGRRESELLALLGLPDVDKTADPRALALANQLAAEDAMRGGRYDAARDRFRKAAALQPGLVAPVIGLAEIDLREGKLDTAAEALAPALTPPPGSPLANLVAADIDMRRSELTKDPAAVTAALDAAGARIKALLEPKDQFTRLQDKVRLLMLNARWLERQPNREMDALRSYEEAAKLGPGVDLEPTIAIGGLYRRLADARDAAKDPVGAADLRAKAVAALAPLDERARTDAAVALSLGIAYLDSDAAKAEATLQIAVAAGMAKDRDIEARFQLSKAQRKLGKAPEALATLDAAYALDKGRSDIGLELARGYESAGRDADAGRTYNDLLANPEVTIDQRGRAGRFFARSGQVQPAREQGDKILAVDDTNPAGLFLRGIGVLADGQSADAAKLFEQAIDRDPDPQYYEALGRARETQGFATGESQRFREARIAYDQAAALDPERFTALLGSGRMSDALYEYDKGMVALKAALKKRPTDPEAQYLLGVAYDQGADPANALPLLAESVKAPFDPSGLTGLKLTQRADAFHRLGDLYYARNNAAGAASAMAEATKLAELDYAKTKISPRWLTDTYYLLGLIEMTRGNKGAAKAAWEKWLARNPTDHVKVADVQAQLLTL